MLIALLMALAIVRECADLAVVPFERVEIKIGGSDQAMTGRALIGGYVTDHGARRSQQGNCRRVDIAIP